MGALGHSGAVSRRAGEKGSDGTTEKPSDQNYARLLTFENLVIFRFHCENLTSHCATAWEGCGIEAEKNHVLGDAGEARFAIDEASQNFAAIGHVC